MAKDDSMAFEDIEHDISIEIKAAQDNNNDRAGKRERAGTGIMAGNLATRSKGGLSSSLVRSWTQSSG